MLPHIWFFFLRPRGFPEPHRLDGMTTLTVQGTPLQEMIFTNFWNLALSEDLLSNSPNHLYIIYHFELLYSYGELYCVVLSRNGQTLPKSALKPTDYRQDFKVIEPFVRYYSSVRVQSNPLPAVVCYHFDFENVFLLDSLGNNQTV